VVTTTNDTVVNTMAAGIMAAGIMEVINIQISIMVTPNSMVSPLRSFMFPGLLYKVLRHKKTEERRIL